MQKIFKRPGDYILIGHQGENLARQICFDISCWAELYGTEGRVELIYQRPGDSAPYPVPVERDGNSVLWTITDTDTENPGAGRAELRYSIGDTLVKSSTSIINVSHSMGVPGAIPDPPSQTWLDQVLEAARRAEAAADRAENSGGSGGGSSDSGNGLTAEASALLITILRNGMYTDDQSANITALAEAIAATEEDPDIPDEPDTPEVPEVTLTSISATYSGGDVAVGTAVTDLTGIVVTAWYSDGNTETVTGYTLSGTIVEGDSVITVTYGGKTATFTVVGVADSESETPHKWANGYFNTSGVVSAYDNYMYCEEYFPVGSGEHYDLFCPNTAWKPDETHICYYDADKNFISRDKTIGAASVESLPGNNGNLVCLKGTEKPENAAFIRVSTHDVSTYKNSLVITQALPVPELLLEDATWTEGYIGSQGGVVPESGCWNSSVVSVEAGAAYRFGNSAQGWSSDWFGVGFYSAVHNGFVSRVTTAEFTVPANAKYVRLSAQNMTGYCETATLTKIS